MIFGEGLGYNEDGIRDHQVVGLGFLGILAYRMRESSHDGGIRILRKLRKMRGVLVVGLSAWSTYSHS